MLALPLTRWACTGTDCSCTGFIVNPLVNGLFLDSYIIANLIFPVFPIDVALPAPQLIKRESNYISHDMKTFSNITDIGRNKSKQRRVLFKRTKRERSRLVFRKIEIKLLWKVLETNVLCVVRYSSHKNGNCCIFSSRKALANSPHCCNISVSEVLSTSRPSSHYLCIIGSKWWTHRRHKAC